MFDRLLMPRVVRHADEVQIPAVAGEDLGRAEELLRQADLTPARAPGRNHPLVARGIVLEVSPSAGMMVKRGRQVLLTPSLGPFDRWVPDVTGVSARMAQIRLAGVGLQIGQVKRAATDLVEPDMVLAAAPAPGSPLPENGEVTLLVSQPRAPTPYWMPDLRGLSGFEVAAWLKALGFEVVTVREPAPAPPGSVLAHTPPAGTPVWPGSRIHLGVVPEEAWNWDTPENDDG